MYKLKKIFKNEKGQGMVEYGLILATVSIVAILGLSTLGGNIKDPVLSVWQLKSKIH